MVLFFHFLFAVPPMEIFPGGSGLSPSKEVNKGEIIMKRRRGDNNFINAINSISEAYSLYCETIFPDDSLKKID